MMRSVSMVASMAYIQHSWLRPWFFTGVVRSRTSSANALSSVCGAGCGLPHEYSSNTAAAMK